MKRFVLAALVACGGSHPSPAPAPPPSPAPDPTPAPTPVATPVPVPPPRAPGPPVAPVRAVKNAYHGTSVADPYQWLEDETPEVKAWSDAENVYARTILDKLPEVTPIRAELDKILSAPITRFWQLKPVGGKLFARRKLPDKQQSELVLLGDLDHPEKAKLVFDPITADHPRRSIDWFVPSPDGNKIALAASDGGSEIADVHVIDLAGKELEVVPNVQRPTAGGDIAWTPDGKGLYYTRYPAAGEKPDAEKDLWQQLYFHQLGTPIAKDRYELGKDLPKNGEIRVTSDPRGRVLATVQLGDGGTYRHYLRETSGTWRQLDDWDDRIASAKFGTGTELWLVSRKDAPRGKVMRLAGDAKSSAVATVVIPEGKDAIVTDFEGDFGVTAADGRLYIGYQLGGPSELRVFSTAGKPQAGPQLPPISTVGAPIVWRGDVLVATTSYTQPFAWQRFAPRTGKLTELTAISPKPPIDLSNVEVRREMATSKDGTQVPVNIAWPKQAAQDGSVPCVVTGYGGFGISSEPHVLEWAAPLLSRGVCVAEANLRGGSEFGDAWHENGRLTKKQNVFDDFNAVLDYMVAKKYTSRAHLGIMGGSNGGLLMGATVVQHPDAMKAVVSNVGIYDMLRYELTPNGAFNTSEYGTVTDEAQFAALYAYSPYHHVAHGIKYPAILFYTGANDGRVAPWQSRKMVAAMQAAQGGSAPIILRTSSTAGHGIGSNQSERLDTLAAALSFLVWQLK